MLHVCLSSHVFATQHDIHYFQQDSLTIWLGVRDRQAAWALEVVLGEVEVVVMASMQAMVMSM